jgi:hypothetical protein
MASTHEQSTGDRIVTPVRRQLGRSSSNRSPQQTIILDSQKPQQPLDYLIWSAMLVISGVLICGFVIGVLFVAAYKGL